MFLLNFSDTTQQKSQDKGTHFSRSQWPQLKTLYSWLFAYKKGKLHTEPEPISAKNNTDPIPGLNNKSRGDPIVLTSPIKKFKVNDEPASYLFDRRREWRRGTGAPEASGPRPVAESRALGPTK